MKRNIKYIFKYLFAALFITNSTAKPMNISKNSNGVIFIHDSQIKTLQDKKSSDLEVNNECLFLNQEDLFDSSVAYKITIAVSWRNNNKEYLETQSINSIISPSNISIIKTAINLLVVDRLSIEMIKNRKDLRYLALLIPRENEDTIISKEQLTLKECKFYTIKNCSNENVLNLYQTVCSKNYQSRHTSFWLFSKKTITA